MSETMGGGVDWSWITRMFGGGASSAIGANPSTANSAFTTGGSTPQNWNATFAGDMSGAGAQQAANVAQQPTAQRSSFGSSVDYSKISGALGMIGGRSAQQSSAPAMPMAPAAQVHRPQGGIALPLRQSLKLPSLLALRRGQGGSDV